MPATAPPPFDHFVGIDWSGARGARHRGIAIAVAHAGDQPPRIVAPPSPKGWARAEVALWLARLPGRVLAGLDFSFAPPFVERDCYLPGVGAPDAGPAFWQWVDARCDDTDLGAACFVEQTHRGHFWFGPADGPKAAFLHWRRCEARFNAAGGGKAATIFDCVGAAQVAKASFAGMRLLHLLQTDYAIWPFRPAGPRTVVEIYARLFLRMAGLSGRKLRTRAELDLALDRLGSAPSAAAAATDHESDALVAAAALRRCAGTPDFWAPEGMTALIARTEGWTFGIR